MRRPLITAVAVTALALTGCGGDSGTSDAPDTAPTCITWTSPTPSGLPSQSPPPAGCVTEQPIGNADGEDVPDCDAEDMLTGDRDCAHVLPPADTGKPKPSPTRKKK